MSSEFILQSSEKRRPERFSPLRVVPLMPNFGARIEGVDLTANLKDDVRDKLREAWLQYGVVIFTEQQTFSYDMHLQVAEIFGTPDLGSPHVEKATSQVDIITTDERRPPATNLWHSDNTTLANPSLGTMIQIQECPEIGGNTGWACTRMAYDCLSDRMKDYLEGLTAIHHWDSKGYKEGSYFSSLDNQDVYLEKVRKYPPKSNPVILTHPLTGYKSIYVNENYTRYIEGVHRYESRSILDFLYSWMRLPEFYMCHNWKPNDVAVWDNFSMQHYGLADYRAQRINQRVTFTA